MKSSFSAVLALLLAFCIILAGCALGAQQSLAPSGASAASESVSSAVSEAASKADTPEPKAESAVSDAEREQLLALFDEIAALETGTAGSSLKAAAVAAHIMDYREDSALSDADICAVLEEYSGALPDSEQLARFSVNMSAVLGTIELILTDEHADALLEDAGSPQQHASYNSDKQSAFAAALGFVRDWAALGESELPR